MDTAAIDKQIRRILTGPEVDLSTISSKRVRKELSETFGSQLIKQNKEVRERKGEGRSAQVAVMVMARY